MGAIMAKAMNSTVGTNKFASFDELLFQQKRIVSGETVLYEIGGSLVGTSIVHNGGSNSPLYVEEELFTIKILCDANFDMKATVGCADNSTVLNYCINGGLRVYRNGNLLTTLVAPSNTGTTSINELLTELSVKDITVNSGDELSVSLYGALSDPTGLYTGTITLKSAIGIYGDIKENCFKTLSMIE